MPASSTVSLVSTSKSLSQRGTYNVTIHKCKRHNVLQLSDAAVPVSGSYSIGRTVKDCKSGQEIVLDCNLTVGAELFDKSYKWVPKTNNADVFLT